MKIMFPIPRITESFVDSVVHDLGWQRYLDLHTPLEGRLNADYLGEGAIIELKILEEQGLRESRTLKKACKATVKERIKRQRSRHRFRKHPGFGEAGGPKNRFDADSKCREEGF